MNISSRATAVSDTPHLQQQPHQSKLQPEPLSHRRPQHHDSSSGCVGSDDLCLPWLEDRFYLNVIASIRDRQRKGEGRDWQRLRDAGTISSGGTAERGYTSGPFFSLERLVDVVSGDGWPGIKAGIFGTMSLEMGRMAEEIPSLFSTSNQTIPVLVLHGDKSLQRRRRYRSNSSGTDDEAGGGGGGDSRGDEDYFLFRKALQPVSFGQRERMEAAGRVDRLSDWKMLMPSRVQVEKVHTGGLGVHHPKFGLLFLNDGSMVVFVGTGNMGVDTAIDATWVQRFFVKRRDGGGEEAGRQRRRSSRECEPGGGDSDADDADGGSTALKGDFDVTLQAFLEEYSWLMRAGPNKDITDPIARRKRRNTPVEFMRRELGIQRLGDRFDFSAAAVDLVPTVPTPDDAALARLPPWERPQWQQRQQQQQRRQQRLQQGRKRKKRRSSSQSPPAHTVAISSGNGDSGSTSNSTVSMRPTSNRSSCGSKGGGGGGGGITPAGSSLGCCWQDPCSSSLSPLASLLPLSSHKDNGAVRQGGMGEGGGGGGERFGAAVGGHKGEGNPDLDFESGAGGGAGSYANNGDTAASFPAQGGSKTDGDADAAAAAKALPLEGGQLRMKNLLRKRRRQVAESGPRDLLILQPTSIGSGIDAGFLEIFAENLMPDSVGSLRRAAWTDSRLDSVRIVWPSMQYIDACREDMSKSDLLRDRQTSTTMEMDHKYVMGEAGQASDWENNGFVFMSPDHFDFMGVDLHLCLQTFQLHPATALALPPRPVHVKSVIRLRKPPLPPPPGTCEKAQHFAWFLLTSACLSKGAQGEVVTRGVRHGPDYGTGAAASSAVFKNVELGVLFHSSPERAYHTAPDPDCTCSPCLLLRQKRTPARDLPSPPPALLPRPVPLPVPFCVDSEPYADPETGSPQARFMPYMHTLKNERPWSVEVQRLLNSKIKEAQFS